jgi:hypothetical protein
MGLVNEEEYGQNHLDWQTIEGQPQGIAPTNVVLVNDVTLVRLIHPCYRVFSELR